MISILEKNQPKKPFNKPRIKSEDPITKDYEGPDDTYPKKFSNTPPPWVTVPAAAAATVYGGSKLAKAAGKKATDEVSGSNTAKSVSKLPENIKGMGRELSDTAKEVGRRTLKAGRDTGEAIGRFSKSLVGKAREPFKDLKNPFSFGEELEFVIGLGLLHEVNKKPISLMKISAAKKAIMKGQKRIIKNPADKVARAQIDGGNRLLYNTIGKPIPLKTVS